MIGVGGGTRGELELTWRWSTGLPPICPATREGRSSPAFPSPPLTTWDPVATTSHPPPSRGRTGKGGKFITNGNHIERDLTTVFTHALMENIPVMVCIVSH